jgi:hypothetical protein
MVKRRIWIVTELFHPEETAVAYIFTRIANFLSNDYEVCVICGPEFYDNNKVGYTDKHPLNTNIKVFRTKTLKLDKNSLLQRSLKVFLLSLQMGFMMMNKVSKGEIVLLATNPAPLLLISGLLKKIKKFRLHILVHDVFPENTIPAQIFKSNKSLAYRFLKLLFDKSYSKADHLIAIGRDMKDVLTEKTKKHNKEISISVVTNWSNLNEEKSYLETKKDINRKIVFQYAGNIGRVQGIDILINSFLLSENPNIHLSIRGTGALYSNIEKLIASNNLKNITLSGSYSRNEEQEVLSNCDVSIVSLSSGMYGLGVPSKTYNLLSSGKPILFIGDPNSEIALMVNEFNIGWTIDINKKEEITRFFNNFNQDNILEIKEKGIMARWLSENKFSENNILTQFQNQLEKNF